MRLLVDALSVNNLSGRYVLGGHLRQMLDTAPSGWEISLLTHRGNAALASDFVGEVEHLTAEAGAHWLQREIWSRRQMAAICRERAIDVVFNPSGMLSSGCDRPQVVLAQNPVPLLEAAGRGQRLKHALQRAAFRRAHRRAKAMVFNSQYMRDLYSAAFGARRAREAIAYQGLADAAYDDGQRDGQAQARESAMILAVSVMARHKAIEVLVDAFARLAAQRPDARLVIAGGWPDSVYRAEIAAQVARCGLDARVDITGHVSDDRLRELYRSARVFCLLSRCESVGIPALEAQAVGTPCVVAAGTAAPEITGNGALVVGADHAEQAAAALQQLLDDDRSWTALSVAARGNAERFRWQRCSGPLIEAIATAANAMPERSGVRQ